MPADPELVRLFAAHCLPDGPRGGSPLHWAWERAHDLIIAAPEEAWCLYLNVLDLLEDPAAVMYAAIALLEDLMDDHPAWFIDRLEEAVFSNPKVAYGVSGLWNRPAGFETRYLALVRRAHEVSYAFSTER